MIGVLASGSGTNLQALLDAGLPVRVVVSDRPAAPALDRARARGVPTELVLRRDHPDRDAFDGALVQALRRHDASWVCLAGFMRLVGPTFLGAFPWRVLNVHPALLPAFPGLHAQRQAFDAGVRVAGCTVHLVDEGTDTGPIVAQGVVPVLPDDDAETLRLRILAMEHRVYPAVARWAVEGRLSVEGRRVQVDLMPGETRSWGVS